MVRTRGYIHLYTGDGKGKTTAAVGLAVRGAGAGLQIIFLQFMKGQPSSELLALERIPSIRILRNKEDLGFYPFMTEQDKRKIEEMHNQSLRTAEELIREGSCDILILDEITSAYEYSLLDRRIIQKLIFQNGGTELILTGRNPDPLFLSEADYVTEMKKVRHPYDKGVAARRGIEM